MVIIHFVRSSTCHLLPRSSTALMLVGLHASMSITYRWRRQQHPLRPPVQHNTFTSACLQISHLLSLPSTYSLLLAQHAPRFFSQRVLNCVRPRGWFSIVLSPPSLVLSCPLSLRFGSLVLAYSLPQQYHFVEVGSGPFELRSLGSTILHRVLRLSRFSDHSKITDEVQYNVAESVRNVNGKYEVIRVLTFPTRCEVHY